MTTNNTIQLYHGRNTDEMVRRLRANQVLNGDEPISALEVRETVLDDEVVEAIIDLLQARTVNTVQLDNCGAYMNRKASRMAWALGSVKNLRLTDPTFLNPSFLGSLLMSASKLTNLKIQNRFDSRQIEAFATGLRQNKSIEELELSRSRLDSFTTLADGLGGNKVIKVLKLRSLGLNDKKAKILVESIKGHPSLETLDMSFNNCEQLDILADLMEHPSSQLKELSVGYQNVWQSPKIEIAGFARVLRYDKRIKILSLARNKLTDSDMVVLATALRCNQTVEQLDVRENLLSDIGISTLAETLESGSGIRRLSVVKNPFNHIGARALLKAIRANHMVFQVDIADHTCHSQEIRYECALNKGGRCLLFDQVPISLWPLVFGRINRLDFADWPVSTLGFSFDDIQAPSHQLDVLLFLVGGAALVQGAVCR